MPKELPKEREGSSELKELILETTEMLLRRYGPAKLSVVDVAREIKMSHGNIYRFFPSKAHLLTAMAQQWLEKVQQPLDEICRSNKPADKKLRAWLESIRALKREKFLSDPQLFAIYIEIAQNASEEEQAHLDIMQDQLAGILQEGVESGLFVLEARAGLGGVGAGKINIRDEALMLLRATATLHHPFFVSSPDYSSDEEADALISFVIKALKL